MPIDPARYAEALRFALAAHGGQRRKGSDVPYITHPVAVSATLAQYERGEDLIIAALLHDTMEDTGTSFAELAERFGRRVAELVRSVTEAKHRDGGEIPWQERKEAQLRHVREADLDTVWLKAADTLHNLQSILRDRGIVGEGVWQRFKAGKQQQLWYYTNVTEAVGERLQGERLGKGLAGELREAVRHLTGEMDG